MPKAGHSKETFCHSDSVGDHSTYYAGEEFQVTGLHTRARRLAFRRREPTALVQDAFDSPVDEDGSMQKAIIGTARTWPYSQNAPQLNDSRVHVETFPVTMLRFTLR